VPKRILVIPSIAAAICAAFVSAAAGDVEARAAKGYPHFQGNKVLSRDGKVVGRATRQQPRLDPKTVRILERAAAERRRRQGRGR